MLTDNEIQTFLTRINLTEMFRITGLNRVTLTKMRQGNFDSVRARSRQIVNDYYENILK